MSSATADVGLQHAGEIGGGLQAGGGVELAADRLDLLGDVAGAAPLGALERHVLEQVRDAVLVLPLVARAGRHPDAERHGLDVRHVVGDHAQAVRQHASACDAHAAAPCLLRGPARDEALDGREIVGQAR